jgi:hypothetical protein
VYRVLYAPARSPSLAGIVTRVWVGRYSASTVISDVVYASVPTYRVLLAVAPL